MKAYFSQSWEVERPQEMLRVLVRCIPGGMKLFIYLSLNIKDPCFKLLQNILSLEKGLNQLVLHIRISTVYTTVISNMSEGITDTNRRIVC